MAMGNVPSLCVAHSRSWTCASGVYTHRVNDHRAPLEGQLSERLRQVEVAETVHRAWASTIGPPKPRHADGDQRRLDRGDVACIASLEEQYPPLLQGDVDGMAVGVDLHLPVDQPRLSLLPRQLPECDVLVIDGMKDVKTIFTSPNPDISSMRRETAFRSAFPPPCCGTTVAQQAIRQGPRPQSLLGGGDGAEVHDPVRVERAL